MESKKVQNTISQFVNSIPTTVVDHCMPPQVAVEDVNGDGQLELVVADRSGNIECYTADGRVLWQTRLSSSCTSGPQVADLRLRGAMDIAVASDDG